MKKIATVLGAGIQGVCVALMLEKRGYHVQLIDKSWGIMNRSSLTHEGKIHLGFVYGMDKSRQTGFRMVNDGLHFSPYLDYLFGEKISWDKLRSSENVYLVVRDSMVTPDEAVAYFESLNSEFQKLVQDSGLSYLGKKPVKIFNERPLPWYVNPDFVEAAFQTEEVSVDQPSLRLLIERFLTGRQEIKLFLEHKVEQIVESKNGFVVDSVLRDGSRRKFQSDLLVNCLWENKVHFDRMLGLPDDMVPSIRLKYGLVVKMDDFLRKIDTFTMIHGPFGNFVVTPDHDTAFCSWYPASMKGIMDYGLLPDAWEQACDGFASSDLVEKLGNDNYEGFKKYIPQLNKLNVVKVTAGVILAEGIKDIDKRDSDFHARMESPIKNKDGYCSVSTSKFTSAPHNTLILEKILFGDTGAAIS